MAPSRIFWISAWRAEEWRHMRPAAILRFFFSAASPARRMRLTPPGSAAKSFSMNTLTPFSTAYSRCGARKAACVVSIATSPGRRQSIALR